MVFIAATASDSTTYLATVNPLNQIVDAGVLPSLRLNAA